MGGGTLLGRNLVFILDHCYFPIRGEALHSVPKTGTLDGGFIIWEGVYLIQPSSNPHGGHFEAGLKLRAVSQPDVGQTSPPPSLEVRCSRREAKPGGRLAGGFC